MKLVQEGLSPALAKAGRWIHGARATSVWDSGKRVSYSLFLDKYVQDKLHWIVIGGGNNSPPGNVVRKETERAGSYLDGIKRDIQRVGRFFPEQVSMLSMKSVTKDQAIRYIQS